MTRSSRSGTEAVKTVVHQDHEVITPPDRLGKKALVMSSPKAQHDEEAIARAEAAMVVLSQDFNTWMNDEMNRLEQARQVFQQEVTPQNRAVLYRVGHDLRGQAATFGFPFAGQIADGLCSLFEKVETFEGGLLELVFAHVDAIRTGVRAQMDGDQGRSLEALAEELRLARIAKQI
jgi:hypothetical protein